MRTSAKRLAAAMLTIVALAALSGCAPTDLLRQFVGVERNTPVQSRVPDESPSQAVPTPTLAATPVRQELFPAPSRTPAPDASTRPVTPTVAAPVAPPAGPFSGTFVGTLNGDTDSQAPLILELEQQGRVVAGTATLGDGIVINAGGFCGRFPVPAATFDAREELDSADNRQLQTTTSVDVEGFVIPVALTVTLSPDGETLTARATLQTPALCANDPTLTGTLTRRHTGG